LASQVGGLPELFRFLGPQKLLSPVPELLKGGALHQDSKDVRRFNDVLLTLLRVQVGRVHGTLVGIDQDVKVDVARKARVHGGGRSGWTQDPFIPL
jgi:hypothetical protein